MDTIAHYRKLVHNLINEYGTYKPSHGEIETEVIIDETKGHYELLHVGWDGERRVHGIVLHIDIIGDEIWVQHDGTSPGVAEELAEACIPRQDIVLGFRPARVRQHTDFGVG